MPGSRKDRAPTRQVDALRITGLLTGTATFATGKSSPRAIVSSDQNHTIVRVPPLTQQRETS